MNGQGRECNLNKISKTYEWVQAGSPDEYGWTLVGHNRQSPKQTPQSPQTRPCLTGSCGAREGAAGPSGRSVAGLVHDCLSSSYQRSRVQACPFLQGLSSLQRGPPPVHLSLSEHSAHAGFPTSEHGCFA